MSASVVGTSTGGVRCLVFVGAVLCRKLMRYGLDVVFRGFSWALGAVIGSYVLFWCCNSCGGNSWGVDVWIGGGFVVACFVVGFLFSSWFVCGACWVGRLVLGRLVCLGWL